MHFQHIICALFILAIVMTVYSKDNSRIPTFYNAFKILDVPQYDGQTRSLEMGELIEIQGAAETYEKLTDFYLPDWRSNVSRNCAYDLLRLEVALKKNPAMLLKANRWALRLIDSWGKSEDGLLQGNRKALGFFQECLRTVIPGKTGETYGRYCLMTLSSSAEADGANDLHNEDVYDLPAFRRGSLPFPGISVYTYYATCIPSSCTESELEYSVNQALASRLLSKEVSAQCQSVVDEKYFDASEIFGIVFFSIILLLLCIASAADLFVRYRDLEHLRGGKLEFLFAFSVPNNLNKIFQVNLKPSKEVIPCVHGIRFLSITWVVLGHQYLYSEWVSSNVYGTVETIGQPFLMQIILNADKSVDTFFCLSGLFVTLVFFRTMLKTHTFSVFKYYIHRVVRLAPPIAIYVCFLATLSGFFVTGPFSVEYNSFVVGGCRQHWWLDLIFVNNFIFRFADNLFPDYSLMLSCVQQSWYVSVDTQIYIFVPFILLPIYYWKFKGISPIIGNFSKNGVRRQIQVFIALAGLLAFGFWTVVSVVVPAVIIGVSGTYPTSTVTLNEEKNLQYTYLVYLMPYCRATAYFVGMWTGYLLWKTRDKIIRLSPLQVFLGWSCAFVAAFAVIFGYYPFNHADIPSKEMGIAASVVYGSLHRGVWAMCVSWVILACHWGYGGMVNSFLSYPAFQPLSRLTYCIFIVSLPLQFALFYSTVRPTYFNHFTKIQETCGVLFMSGIGAIFLTLVSESPVMRFEKLLLAKDRD